MSRFFSGLFKKLSSNGGDPAKFLVALIIALVFWLFQNLSQNYTSSVSVSVTATSNLEGYSNESSNSSIIVARCRTSGTKLLSSRSQSSKLKTVYFNPNDLVKTDDETFTISSDALLNYANELFGEGYVLESFISQEVSFRFPTENHKKVPVQPVHLVTYRPQYMAMSEMEVMPDSVTIYGEPFHLQNIDRVYTENIILNNLKSSAHGTAKLEKISGVRISEEMVNYSLEVTRYVELTQQVSVGTVNVPSGKNISVYPSTATAVFRCAFPLTNNLTDRVKFFVDWNDFTGSINGRCVAKSSTLPAGVISYTIEPQVFEVIENVSR